jgi:hypothetical protein
MTRHVVTVLSLMVAVIAASATTAARSASSAKPTLLSTKGAIESLAMDGHRIAYDLEARDRCNTLHVWDTASKKDVIVSGAGTCDADSTSTGAGVREIAVAGTRISWIVNLGGNTESADTLYAATVGGTKEKKLASALRNGDVDGVLNGTWLGNLFGDGELTVLNRWTTGGGNVSAQNISRITRGLSKLKTGEGSLGVIAADAGRIAVLEPAMPGQAGVVQIVTAAGKPVVAISVVDPREVALRKDFVVVLTAEHTLEVFNSKTGASISSIPVPAGARNLDVHANIAVFSVGKTISALRLATKKQATLAISPKRIVDLEIDDAGVVYAYNPVTGVEGVGKLVFVPLSLVQAKVA